MHVRTEGIGLPALVMAAVLLLAVGLAGPSAAAGSMTVAGVVAVAVQASEPATIRKLSIQRLEGASGGEEIRIEADRAPVWTQYRDDQGNLVIELTNTIVADGVMGFDSDGLVSHVGVESFPFKERPLTRLIVGTSEATEHSLVVDGTALRLHFVPLRAIGQTSDLAQTRAASGIRGAPENPAEGPRPTGVVATRLRGVEVVRQDDETWIRILGDGEFTYSTFFLEDPLRFVIDLEGVVNTAANTSVYADTRFVDQVRMAQFRPYPEPVSRVVLDLRQAGAPTLEASADGLTVRFGVGSQGTESPQSAALASEAAVVVETQAPTVPETEPLIEALAQPTDEELAALPEVVEEAVAPPIEIAEQLPIEDVASEEVAAKTVTPLEIRDETAAEMPWQPQEASDVTLYEAQQITIESAGARTESSPRTPFGVREIGEESQWVGEPISMSLKDSELTEVLRTIARLADLNIVIQPGVSGPVTVELTLIPWDQALDAILKINNLGQQLDGNILRIAPVAQLEREAREQQALEQAKALSVPLATIMRRVSYANADDVARILTQGQRSQGGGLGGLALTQTGILSQRGSVSVDQRTNTLIIRELPSYLNAVIQIIENLDIPEKQVMIEARIVETTRNFSRSLGIDWRFNGIADAAHGNTSDLIFPNNATVDGGVGLLTGGANGFINLGLGNVLNTFQLDVALQAAEAEGLVNVISAPKVAVLNNEQASIQSGLQIPVQTVANNTVTVQFVNATLRLDVTPHVTAEGTILMDINIQKREPQLAFAIVGATNAPIATREAQTRVIVRDGGTAVIGGIYEVSSNDGTDKVPGLANIPIIGHLFRNRNRSNVNEELLIFVTARVIHL